MHFLGDGLFQSVLWVSAPRCKSFYLQVLGLTQVLQWHVLPLCALRKWAAWTASTSSHRSLLWLCAVRALPKRPSLPFCPWAAWTQVVAASAEGIGVIGGSTPDSAKHEFTFHGEATSSGGGDVGEDDAWSADATSGSGSWPWWTLGIHCNCKHFIQLLSHFDGQWSTKCIDRTEISNRGTKHVALRELISSLYSMPRLEMSVAKGQVLLSRLGSELMRSTALPFWWSLNPVDLLADQPPSFRNPPDNPI